MGRQSWTIRKEPEQTGQTKGFEKALEQIEQAEQLRKALAKVTKLRGSIIHLEKAYLAVCCERDDLERENVKLRDVIRSMA